jgi:flavin reductase (DIM6/NTAB) family NADH-FMN oxidoreductase RutF
VPEATSTKPSEQLVDAVSEELVAGFRGAMGRLAAGVVMVTTLIDERPWGLTVSACCSISMAPPMLLVSLGDTTASARAIEKYGYFGVSILGEGLIDAARFGAARGAPKFVEQLCDFEGREGSKTPAIAGAIAHVDCRVARALPVADHVLFIGRVEAVLPGPSREEPLVYHDRRWHRLGYASDLGAAPAPDLWW